MKVSVVIPVYNVKPYLERCVRSVLGQTHPDLEVIMVDDGSTDGSGALADQLATLSPCIRVIHQENQGLSGARNTGIRYATGEYIIFIDSDDEWLLPNGLETLLREAGKDVILFKAVDIWAGDKREAMADYDTATLSRMADAQEIFAHLVATQRFKMSACMLMVRRELLLQHQIYFPIGYISEDVPWSLCLWQKVETVSINNIDFYGYHHRESSITQTSSIRVYHSYDNIFTYWKQQCDENCINADAIRAYLSNLWISRCYAYPKLAQNDKKEAIRILKKHQDLISYGNSSKVQIARGLHRLLGIKGVVFYLGLYWRLRNIIEHNVV